MDDTPHSEENLAEEFRQLGCNLVETLRAAWDRPERQKLQDELEAGLAELAATLKTEAENFAQTPAGQQLKSELDDLRQRINSGEAEQVARQEILNALRLVNAELEKAAGRWKAPAEAGKPEPPSGADQA
ncbi:MAG: hypothetical protein PHS96_03985 [Anaerolineales bacterium]|nr:hypothetical protein [Anaerolineales bacterium]